MIVTATGGGSEGLGDGGAATSAQLKNPRGVAVDGAGNLYIADRSDNRVRRVDASGAITTVAGTGVFGYSGDAGPATHARLSFPHGVAVDGSGNVYIADTGNDRVRKVDASGTITTVAGTGGDGYSGDGGPATAAELSSPYGVAVDSAGNLYIADTINHRIRKVDASGTITTVAGTGDHGYSGDGGPATQAQLRLPRGVAVDNSRNLYIADTLNSRVRKVDASGTITTVAGTGDYGYSGDGGRAIEADLYEPEGVAVDRSGALYIADTYNHRVRKVDASGTIVTVAGTGLRGYSGDGGPATEAQLNYPYSVALDSAGGLYIADGQNTRVRRMGADLLGLAMTDSPDPAATGGEVTYTLTVRNYAFTAASGVRLSDTLPAGTAFRSAVATQGTCGEAGGTVNCEMGDLAAGSTATVTLVVMAPSSPTTLHNAARASAAEPDPFPHDNLATRRTNVEHPVGLSVDIADSPDPVGAGQPLTYTLTVANDDNFAAATDVNLFDKLPPELRILQMGSTQGHCQEERIVLAPRVTERTGVRCLLGTLAPGAAATATIQVVTPAESTVLPNSATVTAAQPDGNPGDNSASEDTVVASTARPAALGVANVDSPDPAHVGDRISYALTVANGLSTPVTGVTLTDTLSAHVTFRSASASQGSCAPPTGRTVACALGTLGPGATATVSIDVTPTAPGDLTNVATVQALEAPDPSTGVALTRVSGAGCERLIESDTTLVADVGPCARDGLIVAADGVTVDLGGHRVFGFPGPGDGNQAGIRLPRRTGVTVRNGTVRDFDAGVVLRGGGSNTVTAITAEDNVGPDTITSPALGDGITVIHSANNQIVGNTVARNGKYDGIGVVGSRADGNTIRNNSVEATIGASPNGQGIIVNARLDDSDRGLTISDTTIEGNVVRGNPQAGISNVNSVNGRILGNTVEGNGFPRPSLEGAPTGIGNGIGVSVGTELQDTNTRILIKENRVHANAGDGIQINFRAAENQVVGNDAADNRGFDLADRNEKCGSNTWAGNEWGVGGYSHECVAVTPPDTAIGSGPSGPTNDDTPTFGFSSSQAGSSFTCRVDSADFAPCTSPYTTPTLADGPHTFEVRATGPVGNTDATPAKRSFTVDATPPETTITAGPSGATADDTPTFEFSSGEEGSRFACRVDAAPFGPCTSPYTTGPLGNGSHTFEVRATDPAGNTDPTPAARSFTVDVRPAMAVADAAAAEGDKGTTSMSFVVSLSSPTTREVSVNYVTADGTAMKKSDYNAVSGTVQFAPGETRKTIVVSIKGDRIREPDETFFVNLSSPTNAALSDGQAVGTIRNDDG
ncbi:MAG: right-handed parallel beta-helix repeat-containing protein [Actinomycetota bacterium]|nr:right-handed parallel beta-helix repeat-containing protein [Actinomycetota bacterium]